MESETDVVSRFLEESPPGEYEQCSSVLSVLVSKPTLLESRAATIKKWNMKQCTYVPISQHAAIICEEAAQSDGSFVDPITYKTFNYNFAYRRAEEIGGEPEVPSNELREELQTKLTDYLSQTYHEQAAVGVYTTSKGSLVIYLRSSSISLENFRTGSVISRYVFEDNSTLSGKIESIQHFFEGGNAVCQNSATLSPVSINGDNVQQKSAQIIEAIISFEEKWIKSVQETLTKIGEEGIACLRRKMPVTKTKINWRAELETGGGFMY
ncbi:F-actin-capping protein subunit alpha [Histomonas meleagridis]|uniref:F-actin-capping protein subunit alpha n=1 Tax=Histomonas meleagridis TaxID=135588 RepID=UPI00355A420F|nr:F-actin-capping protein subunit alpha [Histomonas meleagridis]KAH0797851.1 F-actin-capping protein subunit alpha [Histomonas meleagridis]